MTELPKKMAPHIRRRGSSRDDEWFTAVFINVVAAFLVLVPVTYVLFLGLRLLLLVLGLAQYHGSLSLFAGTISILYGSALMALTTVRNLFKRQLGKQVYDDSPALINPDEHFIFEVSLRAPFVLLFVGLDSMPHGRAEHIVLGSYWGAIAATCAALYMVLVAKRSVSRAWFLVALVEAFLVFCLIVGVLEGLANNDHAVLVTSVEVAPAAAAACALTYFVIWLSTRVVRRGSAVRRPWLSVRGWCQATWVALRMASNPIDVRHPRRPMRRRRARR